MMNHIDISSVLRQTLACDLYSNLVTRSTGAAVRGQIEQLLMDAGERALTVIDFSHVSMIDLSCADEVVAKLLMRYADDTRAAGRVLPVSRRDGAPLGCDRGGARASRVGTGDRAGRRRAGDGRVARRRAPRVGSDVPSGAGQRRRRRRRHRVLQWTKRRMHSIRSCSTDSSCTSTATMWR